MDIMPPDNQLPPHHAPTGLKLWLAVFGVVLVIALSYLVWAQNTSPDTADNSTVVTKKTTANETADWKTYTDSQYNFSFRYPDDSYTYRQITTYTGSEYYVQVYKIDGLDTAGPTFRFEKYGETFAVDSNDPPKETMIITDLTTLKTYLGKIGYKGIVSTTLNGEQALAVDEMAPNNTGYLFGYYIDGSTGYYTLMSSQDTTTEIEKTIISSFKVTK